MTKSELHQARQQERRKRRGDVESLDPSSPHGESQLEELRRRDQMAQSEAKSPHYNEPPDQSMGEYRSPSVTPKGSPEIPSTDDLNPKIKREEMSP
ncbi:MAG TPA: hypothetical protein PLS50_07690, partial [Candidatus Dojkabacteria bacterium]|nr:hypothetical protein [Candidatus Dojkabacteria bacterium]